MNKNNSKLKKIREWVKNNPRYSILFRRNDLNNDERAYCILQSPYLALKLMFETMSEKEKEYCIKKEPYWALRWYSDLLTTKQLKLCEKLLKGKDD